MRIFSVVLVVVTAVSIGLLMGIGDVHYKSEVLAKEISSSKGNREVLASLMRDREENAKELESFADKGQIRIAQGVRELRRQGAD